jgi:hypothetical protein
MRNVATRHVNRFFWIYLVRSIVSHEHKRIITFQISLLFPTSKKIIKRWHAGNMVIPKESSSDELKIELGMAPREINYVWRNGLNGTFLVVDGSMTAWDSRQFIRTDTFGCPDLHQPE